MYAQFYDLPQIIFDDLNLSIFYQVTLGKFSET